jgi:holliday junction DNA helicase RuvA
MAHMISYIKGIVLSRDLKGATIETGGIGYKVFLTQHFLKKISPGQKVAVWTHLAARENSMELFGFENKEELDFFEMLISVSGIGPKTALNILNISEIKTIKEAVSSGDVTHLVKVSGIGRKNAEKIVVELRDKLGAAEVSGEKLKGDIDALEALKSLGYSQSEAREALKKVSADTKNTSAKIKEALKILSSG